MQMKSNKICFCCIRRIFEIILFCEHVICEICVRNIDDEISTFDFQYRIDACMLCRMKKFLMRLRSFTVELRFLNINDEEILKMIAIEFLNVLQSILENI